MLDGAASAYAAIFLEYCAFMESLGLDGGVDWSDDAALVRGKLGPQAKDALAELADIKARLEAADNEDARALDALAATQPISEQGEAFHLTALERYAGRPTGDPVAASMALRRLIERRAS